MTENCDNYWGSHGCSLEDGHSGHHFCCCDCEKHDEREPEDIPESEWSGCVGTYPYYGKNTNFYHMNEGAND